MDMQGQKFGRLLVLKSAGSDSRRNAMWLCQCQCGNRVTVRGYALRNGNTRSCGCLRREAAFRRTCKRLNLPLHDHTYRVWHSMIQRAKKYNIPLDEKWLNFAGFHDDMGDKPSRDWYLAYNKKLGFCKESCRWRPKFEEPAALSRTPVTGV